MRKGISILLIAVLSVSLLFSAAAAQGVGPQGSGPEGGNRGPGGDQPMNQGEPQRGQYGLGDPFFVNVEAIASAIGQVENEETRTMLMTMLEAYQMAAAGDSLEAEQNALQALRSALTEAGVQLSFGDPALYSYSYGRESGRFLDIDKVQEAIDQLADEETATALGTLLEAYREAVESNDPPLVKETLEALMDGLEAAQLEVDEYTGLQLYKATLGLYLDCIAVEAAIVALDNPETVANLLSLLDAYMMAANGGGVQAAQEALNALMDALEAAGIQV